MRSSETLVLRAPGSKSLTQRALVLAALAGGQSSLLDPLECDDSRHLRGALRGLGVQIDEHAGGWRVRGGVLRAAPGPLDCGEGGTTLRFLAPLCLLLDGPLLLEGRGRLRSRPLGELLAALEALGVEARRPGGGENFPLSLRRQTEPGDAARLSASRSSQFLSGLLMVGPALPRGLRLELAGPVVSRPYLELTLGAMAAFGVEVEREGDTFVVPPARYQPCRYAVEGDWSGGAFLLAAAWISGRPLEVDNLDPASAQGDRVMPRMLAELSRPRPHRFDLRHCPDLVAPLAAACAVADQPSEITGAAHARLKESDRLGVLAGQLRRAGVTVEARPDGLRVEPAGRLEPASLDPHGDHRMAMAFGLLSLRQPDLRVLDPGCVSKSYPLFWEHLALFREPG
jgi:3-phosphoshikimate 1-carboxyvinyltransferase